MLFVFHGLCQSGRPTGRPLVLRSNRPWIGVRSVPEQTLRTLEEQAQVRLALGS